MRWRDLPVFFFVLFSLSFLVIPQNVLAFRVPFVQPMVSNEAAGCTQSEPAAETTVLRGCQSATPLMKNGRPDAQAFLSAAAARLGMRGDLSDLELISEKNGLRTTTTRFRQNLDGVPIYDGFVTVVTDDNGVVRSLQTNYRSTAPRAKPPQPQIEKTEAIELATRALEIRSQRAASTAALEWYPVGDNELLLCWKVLIYGRTPLGDFEVIIDADSAAMLAKRDRMVRAVGTGAVFSPNPVQSSGNPNLSDANDAATAELQREVVHVSLLGLDERSDTLRGEFVDLVSISGGLTDQHAESPDRSYIYQRDDDRFEEVVIYHTIDSIQRYIHELGFDDDSGSVSNGIRDFPTLASAHWNSEDQSFYSPFNDTLHFGDGGVDDAEDPDIIAHEYGHAIQYDQTYCWGGGEMGAMGEGFGDYLAASFHSGSGDTLYQATDAPCVAEWDGTSYSRMDPPCLRRVDGDKRYPDHLTGLVHADGEIWSSALWDLRTVLGGREADRLILEHHFHLPCAATMPQAAREIVDADTALNDGINEAAIRAIFCHRGILSGLDCGPTSPLELSISTEPSSPQAGGSFTTVLQLSNQGTDALAGVSLTVSIPHDARYIVNSATGNPTIANGRLVWTGMTLAAGATVTQTYGATASANLRPTEIVSDDGESETSAWVNTSTAANHWRRTADESYAGAFSWFAPNAASDSDKRLALRDFVEIPEGATLRFQHAYDSERGFDGGVVEVSTDGRRWADLGPHFLQHGYDGEISPALASAIATRRAFTGKTDGYIESVASLAAYAGKWVKVRFRFVSDGRVAGHGWRVDNIAIGTDAELTTTAEAVTPSGLRTSAATTTRISPASCSGSASSCDDQNPCTHDRCDPDSGRCIYQPLDDVPCEDGDLCSVDDTCSNGVCVATAAETLDKTVVVAKNLTAEHPRLKIQTRIPLESLRVAPTETGIDVFLLDSLSTPFFVSHLPPHGFARQEQNPGLRYEFDNEDGQHSTANGIRRAVIRPRLRRGFIKAKFLGNSEKALELISQDRVSLTVVFGDAPTDSGCMSSFELPCITAASRIRCSTSQN